MNNKKTTSVCDSGETDQNSNQTMKIQHCVESTNEVHYNGLKKKIK